jgi:uncharacterized protein (DUF1800 family)
MSDPRTIAAIRFGHGLPLPAGAAVVPQAMLAALAGPDRMAARFPAVTIARAQPLILALGEAGRAMKADPRLQPAYQAALQAIDDQALAATRATLARSLAAPDGFRERLVRFWADHFTVTVRNGREKAFPLALVEEAIRPHVNGRFAAMLAAVVRHPAMLSYLDQNLSVGPGSVAGRRRGRGLNENLARELIELHTLGVGGGYGQSDVRELAELLTGLSFNAERGFEFRRDWAEPGAETVLGTTYDGAGEAPVAAVLEDLAARPEAARHIARKLAVHFVADDPDPGLVDALDLAFLRSGGQLAAVYAALLDHPAAWAPLGGKVRQPYDFMIAALRGLGVAPDLLLTMPPARLRRLVLNPMRAMGQPWQAPRGPDGWPEAAAAWITPQGLAARLAWALEAPERLANPLPDPQEFARAALAGAADERLIRAASRAESLRDGVALVLASPAFNRR